MRRFVAIFLFGLFLSGTAVAQQMSDSQVVEYVKQAHQAGKSQKQIMTELMRRGRYEGTSRKDT